MYFNIEKKFEINVEALNAPIILIGWPGIGLVAKLAVSSIIDSLKAQHFLEIEHFDFPPKSTVEAGILDVPTAKVYYKSRENGDLFFLTANFQPQSPEGVFEFTQKFCEAMHEITAGKIKMYVSMGALVTDYTAEIPKVHVCGTDKNVLQSFLELENTQKMDGGIIAGANGILPAWAGLKGYAPGVCLLAETLPLPMMALDPKASRSLVEALIAYFKIDMGLEELNKKVKEMEGVFDSFKKQAEHFMKGVKDDKGPDSIYR